MNEHESFESLLNEERAIHKTSTIAFALLIANSAALCFVLGAIFYFGVWKGSVDQQLQTFQTFINAGDRYPLARGVAVETRIYKHEEDHQQDIKDLRAEWVAEIREVRRLIEKRTTP